MSTPSRRASSPARSAGRTLKPMITASEAMARFTSSWVIAPTPRPLTRTQASSPADIQLEQRVLQGLDRAGHVALDDEQQFLALAGLERRLQALQRDPPRLRQLGTALASLAAVGALAGDPVVGADQEVVARAGGG